MNDPIADLLTRIRNAGQAGHASCRSPCSSFRLALLNVLVREGYLASCKVEEDEKNAKKKHLLITLKYHKDSPVFTSLKRVSKLGLRKFTGVRSMPSVRAGLGTVVLSTSQGVLSGKEALQKGIGGEVLCYVC